METTIKIMAALALVSASSSILASDEVRLERLPPESPGFWTSTITAKDGTEYRSELFYHQINGPYGGVVDVDFRIYGPDLETLFVETGRYAGTWHLDEAKTGIYELKDGEETIAWKISWTEVLAAYGNQKVTLFASPSNEKIQRKIRSIKFSERDRDPHMTSHEYLGTKEYSYTGMRYVYTDCAACSYDAVQKLRIWETGDGLTYELQTDWD